MDKLVMFVDEQDYEDGYDAGCPESFINAITFPDAAFTQERIYELYQEFKEEMLYEYGQQGDYWSGDSFLNWLAAPPRMYGEITPILEVVCYPKFGEGGDGAFTPTVENTPNMPTPYPTEYLDTVPLTKKFDTNARQRLATNLYNDAKKKREANETDTP